jgi:integral membrane sensor domain MASE1
VRQLGRFDERDLRLAAECTGLALVYFGAAKLGLALAFATPSVTAVWPPTGIALAALVLGGRRLWPGVAAGAFLANVSTDLPLYTTLGITVGNTLEAIVGAALLGRVGFRTSLERVRDVVALATLAGAVSTTVSATIGVASLSVGGALSQDLASVWRIWWLGDMGGDLIVAPLIFAGARYSRAWRGPGRTVEALLLTAAIAGTAAVVFSLETNLTYLLFPLLVWAALRYWQIGAAVAALVVAAIAIPFTAAGSGPFIEPSRDESLLLAQTFSAVAALTALVLAVLTMQRRRAEDEMRRVAETLQAGLLPATLPKVPGIEAAARYRAGAPTQRVGGDFYDLFETGPSEWGFAIGDVCGKGPEAASLTALARYTLRTAAVGGRRPKEVLRLLNEAVLRQPGEQRFLTVIYGRLLPEDGGYRLVLANGGHPLPLMVRAGGEVTEVSEPGTLIGSFKRTHVAESEVRLSPGDTILLFTDGLVEGRTAASADRSWLHGAVRAAAGLPAQELAESVEWGSLVRLREPRDDIALLVLRCVEAAP